MRFGRRLPARLPGPATPGSRAPTMTRPATIATRTPRFSRALTGDSLEETVGGERTVPSRAAICQRSSRAATIGRDGPGTVPGRVPRPRDEGVPYLGLARPGLEPGARPPS